MSSDPDRIPVPTNGRGPHPVPDPEVPAASAARGSMGGSSGGPSNMEMSVAFTPKQAAVGFGILASLLLLIVSGARRRRSGG